MIKILISYEKYREAEKREAASLPFLLAEAACGQHKDGLKAAQGRPAGSIALICKRYIGYRCFLCGLFALCMMDARYSVGVISVIFLNCLEK